MARLLSQAGSRTARAMGYAHELLQVFSHHAGFCLAEAACHIGQDTFKPMGTFDDIAAIIDVAEVDSLTTTTVEDDFAVFFAELVERHFYIETVVLGD